jgi:hypothetical protein
MAITPVFLTGFEHNRLAAPHVFGQVVGDLAGTFEIQSSIKRSGDYALKIAQASGASRYVQVSVTQGAKMVARVAFRLEDLSANSTEKQLLSFHFGATEAASIKYSPFNSHKLISYQMDSLWEVDPQNEVMQADRWYVLEACLDWSGATKHLYWRLDEGTVRDHTETGSPTNPNNCSVGFVDSAVMAEGIYFDDWIVGTYNGTAPEWFGDGQIEGLRLSGRASAGSAVTLTGDNPDQFSTVPSGDDDLDLIAAILDDLDPADYLKQTTIIADTTNGYLEIPLANRTHQGEITAVRAFTGVLEESGSGDSTAAVYLRRSDGTDIDLLFGSPPAAGVVRQSFPTPPGGGWTTAEINALVLRFGYANDVVPVPGLYGFLLEIDSMPSFGYTGIGGIGMRM